MNQIQVFCERYGKWMFLFAILFTFAYSFFYETHISNHDYLYYMHLVDEGDYNSRSMIAGTILFSKPLWHLFGHNLWMWKVWSWFMACITAIIPFYALLTKEQRGRYAYIMALVILVFNLRYGLEPPKYAYLFNTIMLTCFVKYLMGNKSVWIAIVSVFIALITFVRFPSFFVWPVVVIAMLLMRRNWRHIIEVIILPVIFFIGLVTITNGGIVNYFDSMVGNVGESSSGSHSLMNLFHGYVTTTTHAIAYMTLICLPVLMYGMWKKIGSNVPGSNVPGSKAYRCVFLVSLLIIAAIMIVHPTEHLSCAMTMAVVVVGCLCNHWNLKFLIVGATIVITNMFCSIGSDCGFVHEYYCASFIPFLLVYSVKDKKEEPMKGVIGRWQLDRKSLMPLLTTLIMILCLATFADKCIVLGKSYHSGIVDGGELSPNLKGLFFSKKSAERYSDYQEEYCALKKQHENVIYWGTHLTHLLSFMNSQWPVTDVWAISSKDPDSKTFHDFVEYVKKENPVVIDIERHQNTESFMKSQGYDIVKKDIGNIYILDK